MEKEWEKEKEKILNSLLGTNQELEFPTDTEVRTHMCAHISILVPHSDTEICTHIVCT